ncbi:hypothetical protein ACTFIW_002755 [Dictyostelium discoideum]
MLTILLNVAPFYINDEIFRFNLLNNQDYYDRIVTYIRVNSIIHYNIQRQIDYQNQIINNYNNTYNNINNYYYNNNNNSNNNNQNDDSDESSDEEIPGGNGNGEFQEYESGSEWDGVMSDADSDDDDDEDQVNEEAENENQYDSDIETGDQIDDYSSDVSLADEEDEDYYDDEDDGDDYYEDDDYEEDEEEEDDDDDEEDDDNASYELEEESSYEEEEEEEIGDSENFNFRYLIFVLSSLICPITQETIVIPAKTTFCTHNQCFDLKGYITHSCHTGRWVCPICDIEGGPLNLRIDLRFEKYLHFYRLSDFDGNCFYGSSTNGCISGGNVVSTINCSSGCRSTNSSSSSGSSGSKECSNKAVNI